MSSIIKIFYKKKKHSNSCYYFWRGKETSDCFQRVINTIFLKTTSIEISLLWEMRKIKLLNIEQILDLNVSTYISLIHPLNPLPTLTQGETISENIVFLRWRHKRKQSMSSTHLRSDKHNSVHLSPTPILLSDFLSVELFPRTLQARHKSSNNTRRNHLTVNCRSASFQHLTQQSAVGQNS